MAVRVHVVIDWSFAGEPELPFETASVRRKLDGCWELEVVSDCASFDEAAREVLRAASAQGVAILRVWE